MCSVSRFALCSFSVRRVSRCSFVVRRRPRCLITTISHCIASPVFGCRRGYYNHSLHTFGSGSAFSEIVPNWDNLPYKCIKYTCQVYHKCIFFRRLALSEITYLRGFSLFKCIKCIIFQLYYRNFYIFFSSSSLSPLSYIIYNNFTS